MSSSSEQEQPGAEAERLLRLIGAGISLAYSLWLIWYLMPEHSRRRMMMRLSLAIQNSGRSAACRAGRLALAEEARSGVRNYHLPLGLSLAAEWAAGVYERLRYTA